MTTPAHHIFLTVLDKGQIITSKRQLVGLKLQAFAFGSIAMAARAARTGGHPSSFLPKTCCNSIPKTHLLTSNLDTIILVTKETSNGNKAKTSPNLLLS